MDFITKLINLIMGKKPESPEDHIKRLEELDKLESARTALLKKKVDDANRIKELQSKVLSERKTQDNLYATLGVLSPQAQKHKNIRMSVILGIMLIFILIIAKSCFK